MDETQAKNLEAVLDDHRELRTSISRIEEAVASPPAGSERERWLEEVSGHLRELGPSLRKHFEWEEASGLYDDIQKAWPGSAHRCRLLLDEHVRLLARVENILEAAAAGPGNDENFRSLLLRIRWLLSDLALHETLENELLYRALEGGPGALD